MTTATIHTVAPSAIDSAQAQSRREHTTLPDGASAGTAPGLLGKEATDTKPQSITAAQRSTIIPASSSAGALAADRRASSPAHHLRHNGVYLPPVIHRDDIRRGRVDFVAVRRREEADRKRLVEATKRPAQASVSCDHARAIKTYTFRDGKLLELYGCGCSNGREILNRRETR
jgi:hypothetical protein